MKKLIYILSLLLISGSLEAQVNLVPNFSFEKNNYPYTTSTLIDSACANWFTPWGALAWEGSSDYLYLYSPNPTNKVPKNINGFQYAKTGNAYSGIQLEAGIKAHISFNFTYKEYIEVELKNELVSNTDYCIDFYYNLANIDFKYYGTYDTIPYFPVRIGVLLTDTLVKRVYNSSIQQAYNICATPTFETQLIPYKDTVNWIHLQGSFTAKGGERYLTIGNFECNPSYYNPDSVAVYIYIDDVRLYQCNPDSANIIDSLIIPNVFTPNGDGYNDKFVYKNQEQWEFETQVFSRWGNLVYDNKTSENWDGTYQGERVSAGVYFYLIKAKAIKTGAIRIYRGTLMVMY